MNSVATGRATRAEGAELRAQRCDALRALGAHPADVVALLEYGEPAFDVAAAVEAGPLPRDDEQHVAAWQGYREESRRDGAAAVLRRCFIELDFPIASETATDPRYVLARRTGARVSGAGLAFDAPDAMGLEIHDTAAGRIPVIVTGSHADFTRLVQALTRANAPVSVPSSMRAMMISGYVNWRRRADEGAWRSQGVRTDRFILLAPGGYSDVPATMLRLPTASWETLSMSIRQGHEVAHYLTRRLFGSMRNRAHDEVLADFAGLVAAAVPYRSDWACRFLGVAAPVAVGRAAPNRVDGRLRNYRGEPALDERALSTLGTMVSRATLTLEQLERTRHRILAGVDPSIALALLVGTIASVPLELLALGVGVRAPTIADELAWLTETWFKA